LTTSAVDEAVAHLTAGRNPLLVLPPGAGKTEVAIEVAAQLSNAGHRPVFLADRSTLSRNFRDRVQERGRGCDVTMAQTAQNATMAFWEKYDVVIIDEAHEIRRSLLYYLMGMYPFMGMTATPFTRGLNFYGPIVSGPTTNDMVREGKGSWSDHGSWKSNGTESMASPLNKRS
jgi:superfamily II DNA or RNA helicase